ncbi:MAG TPA: hypothetical protein DEG17_14235 [Cyanobacteria bacterium UBA11149]|nr:hypothetical protein [Cyanobacteria bacterium UBA11367]HBE56949.1 hypothetical protein [Cyanobacteria bacterium UBA11366]HBK62178.1 hypothetical protein [Cyanobacteria bacterium UBA11166]HBR73389.1 hypothetical protein [Cyanobacteria bacterium UBA11159]HBS67643.1 hypothetical protein [Cyanobacteria bacterium UBA11153]HBW89997.1 hypothetical protein [Cyanobacteria bacterium UBA11149]HCA96442.1 hypothetical protein [Cyanobacteria bacterium UBA9226]
MSNRNLEQPIGSLTPGNVVSAGLRLYRDHLKVYFGIAFRATLWSLLPFLLLIPIIPTLIASNQVNPGIIVLLVVIEIPLLFYCFGKYVANSALIARLSFRQLVELPETLQEARSHVDPKFWIFLRTNLLYFLLYLGVTIGFYLAIALIAVIFTLIAVASKNNAAIIMLMVLAGIVAFGFGLSFFIRFFIRLSMVEVPLAIEPNLNARKTIGRSWALTKGYAGRIFLIFLVAFLVSIPVYIISQIAVSILQTVLLKIMQASPEDIIFQIVLFIISYVLGLIIGVFILPFWQSIKAVIYYDLRTRQEGIDLQLRDLNWEDTES